MPEEQHKTPYSSLKHNESPWDFLVGWLWFCVCVCLVLTVSPMELFSRLNIDMGIHHQTS